MSKIFTYSNKLKFVIYLSNYKITNKKIILHFFLLWTLFVLSYKITFEDKFYFKQKKLGDTEKNKYVKNVK